MIKNASILKSADTPAPLSGDILIEDGLISRIGKDISEPNAFVLTASNQVAMPGFIQTHIHLCQTLFRNYANGLELLDWLRLRIWPFEAAHTEQSLSISARLGILELIKSGTTAILDFGSVYNTAVILDEVKNSGLRASVGITFMDEGEKVPSGLIRPAKESLREFDDLYRQLSREDSGRIDLSLAPRFALSCSEETLRLLGEKARDENLLLHTHASENQKEVAYIANKFGVGNVLFYHKLGMTGPNLCLAHCIWVDESEIGILADTQTRVLHCPSANLKLGSGIADIPRFLQDDILCSLGSDGAPCNNNHSMLQEMRLAGLIQMPRHGPASMTGSGLVDMATINGARTLHLDKEIGSLEVGKKADVILVDMELPHSAPGTEICDQLAFSCQNENIRTVIVDGQILMKDRQVETIDEEETLVLAAREIELLLERAEVSL